MLVGEPHLENHWLKPKPAGPGSGISPECEASKVQDGSGVDRWSGLWMLPEEFGPNSIFYKLSLWPHGWTRVKLSLGHPTPGSG